MKYYPAIKKGDSDICDNTDAKWTTGQTEKDEYRIITYGIEINK